MSFWTAMVVIVAIVTFGSMRAARYRAGLGDRRDRRGSDFNLPSPREEQLTREVDDLRQRIAVLERIATDDRHGRAIAEEIESLRDK
jgi:hypothetical protein